MEWVISILVTIGTFAAALVAGFAGILVYGVLDSAKEALIEKLPGRWPHRVRNAIKILCWLIAGVLVAFLVFLLTLGMHAELYP